MCPFSKSESTKDYIFHHLCHGKLSKGFVLSEKAIQRLNARFKVLQEAYAFENSGQTKSSEFFLYTILYPNIFFLIQICYN